MVGGGVAWTRDPHSPAGVFCELRFGAVSTGIEGASPVLGARVPLFLVENLKPKAASLLPGGSVGKESACSAGDDRTPGSIPGSGRSPGEGNGNPLQYSCLENPIDRGAWRAMVHGVARVGHV